MTALTQNIHTYKHTHFYYLIPSALSFSYSYGTNALATEVSRYGELLPQLLRHRKLDFSHHLLRHLLLEGGGLSVDEALDGDARSILRGDVAAAVDQEPRLQSVAAADGEVKRSVAFLVHAVHVGAAPNEGKLDHLQAGVRGEVQRGGAVLVRLLRIGPLRNEPLDRVRGWTPRRVVQRRIAVEVNRAVVRSLREEQLEDGHALHDARKVDRSQALVSARADACPRAEEVLAYLQLAAAGGARQDRPPLRVRLVNLLLLRELRRRKQRLHRHYLPMLRLLVDCRLPHRMRNRLDHLLLLLLLRHRGVRWRVGGSFAKVRTQVCERNASGF